MKTPDGQEHKVTSNADGSFTIEVPKQAKDSEIKLTPKGGDETTIKVTDKSTTPGTGNTGSTGGNTDGGSGTGTTTPTTQTDPTEEDGTGSDSGKTDDKSDNKTDGKTDGKTDSKSDDKTDGKNEKTPSLPDDKVKVKDTDNLTDDEKNKIIDEVKKANPDAKKVEIDDKGNVVLTYDDGFETSIPYKSLVAKAEPGSVAVPSRDKAHAQDPSKGKKQMNQDPMRNKRNQAGAKNVNTGVGSVSGLVGLAGAAIAGLFATKKKEDEDEDK